MGQNIGYHTRLYSDPTKKVVGGSFGGAIDMQTVERIVKSHFTVAILPSGTAVFVDKQGRQVWLYFTIDARETAAGKMALAAYRAEKEKQRAADLEREQKEAYELEELMSKLTHAEIMRRLSKE